MAPQRFRAAGERANHRLSPCRKPNDRRDGPSKADLVVRLFERPGFRVVGTTDAVVTACRGCPSVCGASAGRAHRRETRSHTHISVTHPYRGSAGVGRRSMMTGWWICCDLPKQLARRLGCAEATAAGLDTAQLADGARARLVNLADHEDAEPATLPDDGLFSGWGSSGRFAGLVAPPATANGWRRGPATGTHRDPLNTDHLAALHRRGSPATLESCWSCSLTIDRTAARAVADRLVAAAEPTDAGLRWRMTPPTSIMPGFSHAPPASLTRWPWPELGRADLIKIAECGAQELLALGDHAGGCPWSSHPRSTARRCSSAGATGPPAPPGCSR